MGRKARKHKRQNYKSVGIAQSKRGDLESAIKSFRRAIVMNPDDSSGYNNLGVALMRQGLETDNIALLRQAEDAFTASMDILPSPSTQNNLDLVDGYLRDRGAKVSADQNTTEVDSDGSSSNRTPKRDANAMLKQRIVSACNERQIRIKVRASEQKSGALSAKKLSKAERLLELCGVVVLERLFTPQFTNELL